mgnify:CR=1 FL=1
MHKKKSCCTSHCIQYATERLLLNYPYSYTKPRTETACNYEYCRRLPAADRAWKDFLSLTLKRGFKTQLWGRGHMTDLSYVVLGRFWPRGEDYPPWWCVCTTSPSLSSPRSQECVRRGHVSPLVCHRSVSTKSKSVKQVSHNTRFAVLPLFQ